MTLISLVRVRCSAWGKFFLALEGFVGAEHFEQATLIIICRPRNRRPVYVSPTPQLNVKLALLLNRSSNKAYTKHEPKRWRVAHTVK